MHVCHIFLVDSSAVGHISCFHDLPTVNIAAVNISVARIISSCYSWLRIALTKCLLLCIHMNIKIVLAGIHGDIDEHSLSPLAV